MTVVTFTLTAVCDWCGWVCERAAGGSVSISEAASDIADETANHEEQQHQRTTP
jgi:hypothetical protein